MNNRFLLFLFLLSGNYFIQAQETFQATLSNAAFTDNLEQQFKNYQLLEVDVDAIQYYLQQEEKNVEVPLSLELPSGMNWDMVLTENGLLSQDYQLYTGGADEISVQPEKRTIRTYSGHLSNGGGQVAVTVNTDFFYGYIRLSNESFFIEPLRNFTKTAGKHELIMYRASDVIEVGGHTCASDELQQRKQETAPNAREKNVNQCYIIQLGVASDYDMYTKYNNSTTEVENHNIGVMNNVQLDYRSEFADNLEYVITGQFVETTNSNTFSTTTDAEDLLIDFAAWSTSGTRNGFNMMNIPHDRGQLWVTRNIVFNGNPNTIGLAYTPGTYHILEDYSSNANSLRGLTTHELGHNYSCTHDANAGLIMSPSNSGSSIWSNQSVNQLNNYIANSLGSSLNDCSTQGAPIADFTNLTAGCPNTNIGYKDNSRFGATRNWTFNGGTPTSGTTPKIDVTYASEGEYTTSLTSFNNAGNNTRTKSSALLIDQIEGSPCEPSGTPGNGGISNFTLANISKSSDNGATSTTKYENFACGQVASLQPNTAYEFSAAIGDCSAGPLFEAIKIYIDYNNNGTFDSGERAFSNSSGYCNGTPTLSFTTPATVVQDEILRLRVIVDQSSNSVNDACHNPTTGQVEDYGAIFRSAPALPIELVHFGGIQMEQSVALNWKTATEKDNDYFQLAHSIDGNNFTEIAQIKGKGDANNEQTYRHLHTSPSNGINYYKLYQVDFSGKKTLSKTIAVDVQLIQMASIAPNPVSSNQLNLRLNEVNAESLQIQIINTQGQIIASHQLRMNAGQLNYNIPLDANLTAGVYHLRILDEDNQQQQTLRLIKR